MPFTTTKTLKLPLGFDRRPRTVRLERAIETAAELLPAQGPITAFVFLNTLQALEDLPFDEGVRKGARLFGCQPYMAEARYRERLGTGRIRRQDLEAVLRDDMGARADDPICSLATRYELRLAMLEHPLRMGPAEELRWFVAETDSLRRLRPEASPETRYRYIEDAQRWVMREVFQGVEDLDQPPNTPRPGLKHLLADLVAQRGASSIERWSESDWENFSLQALWKVCSDGVKRSAPPHPARPPLRHRDLLLEATARDSDSLVHEVLIRFSAAFADQGLAEWSLPDRDRGFYQSFAALYRLPGELPQRWLRGLAAELNRLQQAGLTPLESILESLELLGVSQREWENFLPATLLALRGWAGMLRQMEIRGDRVALPAPQQTLVEFLAVRLILERLALAHVADEALNYRGPLDELRDACLAQIERPRPIGTQRAFAVFQLAQVLGWRPSALHQLSRQEWARLVTEVEAFPGLERRRIFHQAFERRFRGQALDALSSYTARSTGRVEAPRFQAVFCIDTREESFRRHLEELAPQSVETFGAAGFFCVPIYYRSVSEAHFAALCPIVVQPQHWVVEDVVYPLTEAHRRRAKTRRALGTASRRFHVGSRAMATGALLTAGMGVLASIPLVARVLFPRLTARIRRTANRLVAPPPITRLRLERSAATAGPEDDQVGFTVAEMANFGERTLRDIGLTSGFARLVMFLGHGSSCLNNPHKSAYDCGACSGSAGSPNARALAGMLNDLRVRKILSERGLPIPADTHFLGGLHDTCADSVRFFDLDQLPKSHIADYEAARATLELACQRNAHERCRRFDSAPLKLSFAQAQRHVEDRAEDLAQTRPEFGNATNAMCFVGRRHRVRGLYLDRRSFLVSYDPQHDDQEHGILARILGAVVPVAEGINLQYLFSYIDSTGWGCGTKLPHNITSLLGVMDGAASDLRSGLPWQGVEIHEPVRLLFVIEAAAETMLRIMERNPVVGRILRNGWAQLAVLDPDSSQIQVYRQGRFHDYRPETSKLATAESSFQWYRGQRDHLGFAAIDLTRH